MVNGVPYQLKSETAFLHGSLNRPQLTGQGSFVLNFRGLEIRGNRYQCVRCRLRNGETRNVKFSRKQQSAGLDISGSDNLQASDPGKGPNRVSSLQSGAAPASEMDMTEEEESELNVDDDDVLKPYRGLVLDVAYRPINVVNWKRALCLDILEKADVLEYYDQVVCSASRMFFIPAVLKLNGFVHTPKHEKLRLGLNRNNIFMRDKYRCQYCNSQDSLTIDHVFAASRGGGWTWDNLVTACSPCNLKKANKTLEEAHMTLIRLPKEPKVMDSINLPPNYKTYRSLTSRMRTPSEWLNYLPNSLGLLQ